MGEINLTQDEASFFLKMKKIKVDNKLWDLPDCGGKICVPLTSLDKREFFLLDVSKGRIVIERQKYQTRIWESVILARLDLRGGHRNPDGEEVGSPHLHLYREGYGDKWAFPVPDEIFKMSMMCGKLYMIL